MTQFVRTFVLALTYGRLPARSKLRKLGFGVVVMSGLIASVSHAEEAKRCAEFAARLDSLEGKVQWQVSGDSQWQSASLNQTFCYGDIILVQEKRAALRLSNNTLVRLNENSSIKLIPPQQSFWVELIDGAAHFLTRTPKSFTVKAPFVNAAVEGTEFLVTASNGVNQVGVIEGVVRSHNPAGSVLLTQGMSTQTGSTQQAPGAPVQLKLNDFVSWAMYFPPLPNRLNLPADIKTLLEQGRDGEVIARISRDAQASAEILSLGAALALNRGQLPQAEELVQRAFKLNPKHPDAQAIAALVDLGRGEAERGQQRAAQNVLDNPFNPTALIAHSYSQQGQGRLQGALDSALEARRLTPTDSQIIARVAELHLALGQKSEARKALDEALALTPNHSRLLTFKGFSLLAERKGKTAQTYFAKASQQDSADPYAQLGWGLSLIQQGKLESGREHLELAVILDPANSLLRSYLGKGYFEENRLKLAETQLNLAQTLDPNDPTPWYYLSQVKHDQHRYGEALQLVETSIDKNTNRAVYRAEGAIGSDAAARLADKSRIYQAMGAERLATIAADDAIKAKPNDYLGHRAMALALTGKSGSQTMRANESLQSSLLAPIGATPLAPGFGESALATLPGAGPHELGINEYNSVFLTQGINGHLSSLVSANNTLATEAQLQLVGESADISLGQYHYSSDGFKENNDRDYLINEARLKYEAIDGLLLHFRATERSDEMGDITDAFVKNTVASRLRKKTDKEAYSMGFSYVRNESFSLMGQRTELNETIDSEVSSVLPSGVTSFGVRKTELSPNVTEVMGSVFTSLGAFHAGTKVANYPFDIATKRIISRGAIPLRSTLESSQAKQFSEEYYLDYDLATSLFEFDFGYKNIRFKDFVGVSDEDLFRAAAVISCGYGSKCIFAHDEFVSLPFQVRDQLRNQFTSMSIGRSDYQPYARVIADGALWRFENDSLFLLAEYQKNHVTNPAQLGAAGRVLLVPEYLERELAFSLGKSFAFIDLLSFEYDQSKSSMEYLKVGESSGDTPINFETRIAGLSVEEGLIKGLLLKGVLKSVDQQYVIADGRTDNFFETRVRFVNLDLSLVYSISGDVSVSLTALNALDNSKGFIEESLANSLGESVAGVDQYLAERVYTLSAKVQF